jgi:hypothetical protein
MYQELPETDSCVFGTLLGIGVRPVTDPIQHPQLFNMYQELPETDSCVFGTLLGIGVNRGQTRDYPTPPIIDE